METYWNKNDVNIRNKQTIGMYFNKIIYKQKRERNKKNMKNSEQQKNTNE